MEVRRIGDLVGQIVPIDGEWLLDNGYHPYDFRAGEEWLLVLNHEDYTAVTIEYFEKIRNKKDCTHDLREEEFTLQPYETIFITEIEQAGIYLKIKIKSIVPTW